MRISSSGPIGRAFHPKMVVRLGSQFRFARRGLQKPLCHRDSSRYFVFALLFYRHIAVFGDIVQIGRILRLSHQTHRQNTPTNCDKKTFHSILFCLQRYDFFRTYTNLFRKNIGRVRYLPLGAVMQKGLVNQEKSSTFVGKKKIEIEDYAQSQTDSIVLAAVS